MFKGNTVHLCALDKFIPPFIEFVDEKIGAKNQLYFLFGDIKQYPTLLSNRVIHMDDFTSWIKLFIYTMISKKIILHSMLRRQYVIFMFLQPWLLSKTYWIMWGADLYYYLKKRNTIKSKIYEFIRSFIIKNVGFLVTGTRGDIDLARNWYGAKGQWIKCFNYPSNIFKHNNLTLPKIQKNSSKLRIMIGNSADPSNNHIEAFEKIRTLVGSEYEIICPLAYGNKKYAEKVKIISRKIFGNNIIFIESLLPYEKYIKLISKIDILIFNHDRQQGLGNLIVMLGLGKKVYLKQTSLYNLLNEMGLKIYDANDIRDLNFMTYEFSEHNNKTILENFSEEKLIKSLSEWIL